MALPDTGRKESDFVTQTSVTGTDLFTFVRSTLNCKILFSDFLKTIFTKTYTNDSDFTIDNDATAAGSRTLTFRRTASNFSRILWNEASGLFQLLDQDANVQRLSVANATNPNNAVPFNQMTTIVAAEATARQNADNQIIAQQVFTHAFVTGQLAITNGGSLTVAHDHGKKPTMCNAFLQCVVADNNYKVGEEIPVQNFGSYFASSNGTAFPQGFTLKYTNTQLLIRYANPASGATVFPGVDANDGSAVSFTNSSWRLVLRTYS